MCSMNAPLIYCMVVTSHAWAVMQVWLTVTLRDWTTGDSRNCETNFARELWLMLRYSPPGSAWEEHGWMLYAMLVIGVFVCKCLNL